MQVTPSTCIARVLVGVFGARVGSASRSSRYFLSPAVEYSAGSTWVGAALLSATVTDSASDGKPLLRTSAT